MEDIVSSNMSIFLKKLVYWKNFKIYYLVDDMFSLYMNGY